MSPNTVGWGSARPPFICWGLRPQTPAAEAEYPAFFAGGSAPRPSLQPANSRKIKKSSRWRRFCLRRHRDDFLILIPHKLGVRISRSPTPKVMVKVGKSVYLLIARCPIPPSSPRILCPPPSGPHPQTPLAHISSGSPIKKVHKFLLGASH